MFLHQHCQLFNVFSNSNIGSPYHSLESKHDHGQVSITTAKLDKLESPENLVFAGGGVKCLAYAGVIKGLDSKGLLSGIKRVRGTSAGSIAALFLALRIPVDKILDRLGQLDTSIFRDHHYFQSILLDWPQLLYNLDTKHGLYSGNAIEEYLQNLLQEKTGNPQITFQQFLDYQLNSNNSLIAKSPIDLSCKVTNLNTGQSMTFDINTVPNMPIYLAIRASCSLPIFYSPVSYPFNDQVYDWVDGGFIDNYDLSAWDVILTNSETGAQMRVPNPKTLGFRPFSSNQYRDSQITHQQLPTQNLYQIITALIEHSQNNIDRLQMENDTNYWNRTVTIPVYSSNPDFEITTTSFELTPDQRQFLIDSGYSSTIQFLQYNHLSN